MKRIKMLFLIAFLFTVFVLPVLSNGQQEGASADASVKEWTPSRPISFVVPYAAGGAIDRITRALQPHMEEYLGVPCTIVNMPGGSTVIAYEHVYSNPVDGYTVLCLSPECGTMAVMGHSELTPDNWIGLGITAAFSNNFVVHPDSPIKDLEDLIEAMKKEKLTCACAANGGAWSQGIMLLAAMTGGQDPELIPQGGGFIAAQAAMKKEVDFASNGLSEVIDLLVGKQLRSLAYYGTEPYILDGYGTIPTVMETVPEAEKYSPFGGWTGLAVREETPQNIVDKFIEAYKYAITQDEFINYINENAFTYVNKPGKEAQTYMNSMASVSAWLLYEKGIAPNSPADFGIEK